MSRLCMRKLRFAGGRFRVGLGLLAVTGLVAQVGTEPAARAQPTRTAPAQAVHVEAPSGFPPVPIPDDNPITAEKLALGQRLFFDPILSLDNSLSCADCHLPDQFFADTRTRSLGVGGVEAPRNTPTILNTAYYPRLLHDGRSDDLEDQARYPVTHQQEMRTTPRDVVAKLKESMDYRFAFARAFGGAWIDWNRVSAALATFERTLLSGDSDFDRYYLLGDAEALDPLQQAGWELFQGRAGCIRCHAVSRESPFFTDHEFHNTGVSWDTTSPSLGRYHVTKQRYDKGRQRTPSLRNVAETPPYMHDGRFATLDDVLDFYAAGGIENRFLDEAMTPLELSADDRRALVAFLHALTGTVTAPSSHRGAPAASTKQSARTTSDPLAAPPARGITEGD